ncbi:hypothetical protein [Streptomyces sp. NPDC007205]|uniref:hypothetical protein n=1 Tax=Streptomyces sp. NPDC007205 TaxID=3154316 RepID=UPI0033D0BF0D
MLRVLDSVGCEGAVVESDPWVPMKVTWLPRPAGKPVYLRISGVDGGEVELKIDPLTGMLVQAIVIELPPEVEAGYEVPIGGGTPAQSPVVDRSPQGRPDAADLDESVVRTVEKLAFFQTADRIGLVFGDQEPARHVQCDDVTVAISSHGDLTAIVGAL